VVDKCGGMFREPALARRKLWIHGSGDRGSCKRYDRDEWVPLMRAGRRVADHHARARAPLFAPNGWI